MIRKNWKSLPKQLFKRVLPFFSLFARKELSGVLCRAPLLFCLSFSVSAYQGKKNYSAEEAPHSLRNLEVTEKTGQFIDLNLKFYDTRGELVPLKNFFSEKAVLMTVVYYNCPSLCNFHLNGLFSAMQKISQTAGKDYEFVAVSMDARETPSLARDKKANYLKEFSRPEQEVRFLTGLRPAVKKLTDSLGFAFRWDEKSRQFAHSPVAYLLSSDGRILRYLYGVEFEPDTLQLSLVEAGQGRTGTWTDRIRLFCYRFDPGENRYTLYAYNIMRAGAGLMAFFLFVTLASYWLKARKVSS